MRKRDFTRGGVALLLMMIVPSALGQASTSLTTTSAPGSGVSSATSSAIGPTQTGGAANQAGPTSPTVELPPLVACSYATFSFTIPQQFAGLPKHLGFYPSTTSSWIETFDLPQQYNSLTEGSFTWLVDLPVGLSVAAMFYVTDPNASGGIPTNGTASTSDGVILAGTSNGCLAQNGGASTTQVVSYASRFDPAFVWSAASRPTSNSDPNGSASSDGNSSPPIGAIVGGVVGGIAAITIIALILLYLRKKHRQAAIRDDGYSMYSATTAAGGEKRRYGAPSTFGGYPASVGVPTSEPPPGTYWGADENGNTILLAHPDHAMSQHQTELGAVPPEPVNPAPRRTAAMGTLPEPMGDESLAVGKPLHRRPSFVSNGGGRSSPPQAIATPSPFTPQQELKAYVPSSLAPHDDSDPFASSARGAEGLDDPNSFSPARQTHH